MSVKLAYNRNEQFSNGTGVPYSGAKLFTYVGGSVNTKQTTYTESTGSTPNTNPINLDSAGQLPQPVWLTTGLTYKFVLAPSTDTDPPTSPIWTLDGITGINDSSASQSEWIAGPTPTFVSTTQFTLVGDQTTNFAKSRRLKFTVTAGTVYGTITASAFAALTTVTVALDSGNLDSGLSAVSYGIVAAANPSIDADLVNRKGAAVASAATTDIWSIAGDFVHVTGSTGPITSFGTAPYAGAQRVVIFDSTPTITYNATTLQLPGAVSIVAAAGDRAIVRADTTANMIVVEYIKANGAPASLLTPNFNWTFNTDFRIWGAGTATVPTGWTANGASATYAKNTTAAQFKWGGAGIAVTRVGTDCYASQAIDTISGFGPVGAWQSRTVTFGAWVYATVASRVRLSLNDGVGTTNSSYHSGGSTLEFLTLTRVIDASATKVELRLGVDTGNTTGVFSGAVLVVGPQVFDFIPPGWTGRKAMFGATIATGATQAAGSTTFYKTSGGVGTESNASTPIPFTRAVARNLQVIAGGSPGGSETYTITLRKNSADTSVTCTISAAATTASDTTHEVLYAAGDSYTFKNVTSGGASSISGISFSTEIEEVPLA